MLDLEKLLLYVPRFKNDEVEKTATFTFSSSRISVPEYLAARDRQARHLVQFHTDFSNVNHQFLPSFSGLNHSDFSRLAAGRVFANLTPLFELSDCILMDKGMLDFTKRDECWEQRLFCFYLLVNKPTDALACLGVRVRSGDEYASKHVRDVLATYMSVLVLMKIIQLHARSGASLQ